MQECFVRPGDCRSLEYIERAWDDAKYGRPHPEPAPLLRPPRSGQRPPFAEGRFEIRIRLAVVGEPCLGCVPLQLSPDTHRDRSQQHPFHEWNGDIEVRTCRIASFAGANPIA